MNIVGFVTTWLLQQTGGALFGLATQHLLESMGLDSLLIPPGTKSLLDEYLQKLMTRLDEDRIGKLHAAFSELRDSSKSARVKQSHLEKALDRFHDVINLPQQGMTGGYQNAQLRCLAFLGMATAYKILNDNEELIAENIVEAVYADHLTALQFLEKSVVRPLLALSDCTLIGHNAPLRNIVFSPDGETLASGGEDNTLRLWDTQSGDLLLTYTNHNNWVNSVAFSPDGKLLASGSSDKTIRLWDVLTGQLKETILGHTGNITSVAFSLDGKILASGSVDQTTRLWYLENGEWQGGWHRILSGQNATVWSIAFSPDGKSLASAVANEGVRLWGVKKIGLPQIFSVAGMKSVPGIISVENKWDQFLREMFETKKGRERRLKELSESFTVPWITSVAFSLDGETLATGSTDKTIQLWNIQTGELTKQLEGHLDSVQTVSFSPDGKTFASGSNDKTIRLWRIR